MLVGNAGIVTFFKIHSVLTGTEVCTFDDPKFVQINDTCDLATFYNHYCLPFETPLHQEHTYVAYKCCLCRLLSIFETKLSKSA